MADRWAIYEIVDGDTVLYIGCSKAPDDRHKAHRRRGLATDATQFRIVAWWDHQEDAFADEASRIFAQAPPWNKVHVGTRWRPTPWTKKPPKRKLVWSAHIIKRAERKMAAMNRGYEEWLSRRIGRC